MNSEQKKPIEAEELTEKELEGVVGGTKKALIAAYEKVEFEFAPCPGARFAEMAKDQLSSTSPAR